MSDGIPDVTGDLPRPKRHEECSDHGHMATVTDRVVAERYVLRDVLGAGAMGTVYRADDLDRRCAVALKLLHRRTPRACEPHRPASERLAGAIRHPNVVAVCDAGVLPDGTPFLVMELVRGVLLDELVHTDGPLALRRATAIVGQILAGLQALHDGGFVHGDVKSRNVLIDAARDDRTTLIDLGLAHDRDASAVRTERIASGTPEYMAPEVVRGDGASARSDVYAAGTVMYQLLTGTTPFEGGAAHEILRRQLDEIVVPPSLRCPDRVIPPALEAAVMAALEKDPAARPASAAEFAQAIAAATPSSEPPGPRGEARQMFSTDAPTIEWSPPDPPGPVPVAIAARHRPSAAASSGGVARRPERSVRGRLPPCRRSTATRARSAWSIRRRR